MGFLVPRHPALFVLATLLLLGSGCSALSFVGLGSDSESGSDDIQGGQAGTDSLSAGENRLRTVTGVETMIRGEAAPRGIALGRDAVFWTSSGDNTLRRLGFGEPAPRTLASFRGSPFEVLVDFDTVYVHRVLTSACDAVIEKVPATGGDVRIVSTECDGFQRVAEDATSLLGTVTTETSNGTRSKIVVIPKDPGTLPTSLFEDRNVPGAIRSDGTLVYWVRENDRTIMKAPKTSDVGQVQLFSPSSSKPMDLALDQDTVYWIGEGGEVLALAKAAPVGTPATVIATGEGSPTRLVESGGYLYWTATGTGLVRRARKPGRGGDPAPETIARDLVQPYALAVAADAVWVTTRAGDVVRIGLAP